MILVAGGTGMLGTMLVRRLVERGADVRVLTRNPSRANHLRDIGVDIAQGDLRDRSSLARALVGVDTVVAAAHGFGDDDSVSPAAVDRQGNLNLIDAAARTGAAVVLMSIVGAGAKSGMELFRAKHAAEEYLRASTVRWTIVRATAFVETWAAIIWSPLKAKGMTLVFGRGENPINFVSVVDVASAVERAVIDPSLRGETIEIGGPANLTFNQMATMLNVVCGRPDKTRHVPRLALRLMGTFLSPFKPSLARHARAALLMDSEALAFDSAPGRARFPDLPTTDARTALGSWLRAYGG